MAPELAARGEAQPTRRTDPVAAALTFAWNAHVACLPRALLLRRTAHATGKSIPANDVTHIERETHKEFEFRFRPARTRD